VLALTAPRANAVLLALALTAIIAFGLSFRIASINRPLDRDEGAHAYIGSHLFSGLVPYQDAYDNKPPGVYAFYAIATLGPGDIADIRAPVAFLFAGSILLVYSITARVYGRGAGVVAAFAYAVLGNEFAAEAERANTEQLMVPFLLASVWLTQRGTASDSTSLVLLAGACTGGAVLMKQVGALPAAILVAAVLVPALKPEQRTVAVRRAAWFSAGAIVPCAVAVLAFAANGALGDARYWLSTYSSDYVRSYWDSGHVDLLNFDPVESVWLIPAAGALLLHPLLRRDQYLWHYTLIGWTLANAIGAKVGLRDFAHYFVPMLPGIAILSGAFIWCAARRLFARLSLPRLAPAVAASLAAVALFAFRADNYFDFYFQQSSVEAASTEFGPQGPQVFVTSSAVADFVRENTTSADRIIVWAAEPQVYYLGDREAATPHLFPSRFDILPERQPELTADFLASLPPVVVTYKEGSPIYPHVTAGVYELLAENGYTLRFEAGWLVAYVRD
jgi:4-amino-4-deoxy-L-arabinose transferase-like glycosyltransferase